MLSAAVISCCPTGSSGLPNLCVLSCSARPSLGGCAGTWALRPVYFCWLCYGNATLLLPATSSHGLVLKDNLEDFSESMFSPHQCSKVKVI